MNKVNKVFISYETKTGKSYAEHLKEALEEGNYSSFLADLSIDKGTKWKEEINLALNNCKYFVVVITSLTLRSKEVIKEYKKAMGLKKRIIPCRYSQLPVTETGTMSELQQLEFSDKYELANKVIIELNKINKREEKQIPIEKDANEFLNRGILFYNIFNFRKAIDEYEIALEIFKEIGDKAGESTCYRNLGVAYGSLGDFRKAIEFHENSLKIDKEIGDKAGESVCYTNLGMAYDGLGNFRKAIEFYLKAEKIFEEIGQKHYLKIVYKNIAVVYEKMNNPEKVEEYKRKAEEI